MRARIAAYSLHAQRDARETTAPARAAFLARFEDLVDPDRILTDAERVRRAESARKAHFTRLALRSAQHVEAAPKAATADAGCLRLRRLADAGVLGGPSDHGSGCRIGDRCVR